MMPSELDAMLASIPVQSRPMSACSIIGHSMIVRLDFGYAYCARCEEQIGDALAGGFMCNDAVTYWSGKVQKCPKCENNEERLTWKDLYLVPADVLAMLKERAT